MRAEQSRAPSVKPRLFALSDGAWSVMDQGVVSLGMFLTTIILARTLAQRDFGIYTILLSVMLLLNGTHSSLITYPLIVDGPSMDSTALLRRTRGLLVLTVLLVIPVGVAWLAVSTVFDSLGVSLWGLAAVLLWQVQETTRKGLMAEFRYRSALWGDALSYLGQSAVLWALASNQLLTLPRAFVVMCFTSAAAAVVQALQMGLVVRESYPLLRVARRCWQLGRWILLSNGLTAVSTQTFCWGLAAFHGLEASASYQAAMSLLGVTHPVLFSLGNVIVPAVAYAQSTGGRRSAWTPARRYGLEGLALVLPYFVVLCFWPKGVLSLVYGEGSPYMQLTGTLRTLVLAYIFSFFTQTFGSYLGGLSETKSIFVMHFAGAVASLCPGLPLTARFGVIGACSGFLLLNLVRSIVCIPVARRLRCLRDSEEGRPDKTATIGSVADARTAWKGAAWRAAHDPRGID